MKRKWLKKTTKKTTTTTKKKTKKNKKTTTTKKKKKKKKKKTETISQYAFFVEDAPNLFYLKSVVFTEIYW